MAKKIIVVTTKKACEMLDCSRNHFHRKYKPQLTNMEMVGKKCVYQLSEVQELVEIKEGKKPNYKIIE